MAGTYMWGMYFFINASCEPLRCLKPVGLKCSWKDTISDNIVSNWKLHIQVVQMSGYFNFKCIQCCIHVWTAVDLLCTLHTLRVHYAHAAANLNSGYSKYAKVACVHYFCTIALRTSCAVLTSVSARRVDLRERRVDLFSKRVIIFC